jgi:branched-chain amino acid transport system permease protein
LAVWRAQEFYFAIATLSVTQVGLVVFQRWRHFTGPDGTALDIRPISLFGHTLRTDRQVFWVFLGALTLALLLAVCIERSPLRREAIAARDRGVVARTVGVPVVRVQLVMFVLGSVFGGIAGSFIAHWSGFVGTDSFNLDLAIGVFLMLMLGGMHSPWGPVIGAGFYVVVPDVLSKVQRYQSIVYGLLLLAIIIAFPQGLVGLGGQLRRRMLRGPAAPGGEPPSGGNPLLRLFPHRRLDA